MVSARKGARSHDDRREVNVKIREKISAIYWDAVEALGPLVPTPQVIGSGLAAIVVGLIDNYAIDISVVGLDSSVIVGAIVLGIAWLIGPERRIQGVRLELAEDIPPQYGYSDGPPVLGGQYIDPEDSNAPGSGLV